MLQLHCAVLEVFDNTVSIAVQDGRYCMPMHRSQINAKNGSSTLK